MEFTKESYLDQELLFGKLENFSQKVKLIMMSLWIWFHASAPSIGHCNTMGTASSMNSVAEALGMSLTGCAVIPAPYREREQISFETGKRIVGMVHEDLKPSKIMTRKAFENAVVVASAIGASSNCTTHLIAIAKHMGIKFDLSNWQKLGHQFHFLQIVSQLVNI